jgi:glycosyltransferase involved in cell wall biosynthesis
MTFIGNLYADKNPEFLLDALSDVIALFPDIKLHIYGEDRYNKD